MERRIAHILNLGGDDNLRLARFSEKNRAEVFYQ